MKLKNTVAVKIVLITFLVSWLCQLPRAFEETAGHDIAFAVGFWSVYVFFNGAAIWGLIQLSSLRKQAKEFAGHLEPAFQGLASHE
jgi:hypothetical protein